MSDQPKPGFGRYCMMSKQGDGLESAKARYCFKEAISVFKDPLSITTYDPDHSKEEDLHHLRILRSRSALDGGPH